MNPMSFSSTLRRVGIGIAALLVFGTGCAILPLHLVATPLPNIPATALLLDINPFPRGWTINQCYTSHCFSYAEASREFYRTGVPGHVIQNVFQFSSLETAQAKFQLYRETDFKKAPPPQSPSTDFLPPSEIIYRSPIADEYYFGCGVDVGVPACRALFRYRNYVVEFYLDLDSYLGYGLDYAGDGLELEQVEPILRAMDSQAGSVLGIPIPTRTP